MRASGHVIADAEAVAQLREELEAAHRLRREIVTGYAQENQELRNTVDRLAVRAWQSQYDVTVAEWKLASLRQRRWWLLGSLLGQVRRSPSSLLRLPLDLVRLARRRPQRLPRPPRPAPPTKLVRGESDALMALSKLRISDVAPIPRRLLLVGCLLDDRRVRDFEHEWQCVRLTPSNWEVSLREARPELLFVSLHALARTEDWVTSPSTSSDPATTALTGILDHASADAVTTCIWVDDRAEAQSGRWNEVIASFDVVLCLDDELTETLRGLHGPEVVMTFGPSFQSRLANPGSHAGRRRSIGLSPVGDPHEEGLLRVAEALRAEPVDVLSERPGFAATKASDFAVAVDTSTSPSIDMLERLLINAAGGTPTVIAGSCPLPDHLSAATVRSTGDRSQRLALRALRDSEAIRARQGHKALRVAMRDGSTRVQVDGLLRATGIDAGPSLPGLSLVIPTNRSQNIPSALAHVAHQTYARLEVVLVLHGIDVDEGWLRESADGLGIREFSIVRVPADVPLGEVLNIGFSSCSYPYVGKIDDDDFYAEEYAHDLMSCFEFADTEVVGKWTHYAFESASNELYLRYPGADFTFQRLVAISTLMFKREVLEQVRFPPYRSGSGSAFLHELRREGGRVFSGDRYNYLYVRNSNVQHTWRFEEFEIAAHSHLICRGMSIDEVTA